MKIMLPVDGSEGALAAVHHAIGWVRDGLRADFLLANVQEPASLYEVVTAHDAGVIEEVSAGAAAHALEPAAALLRAAGIAFETEIAHGDPAHRLVELAEQFGCQAIVIGARGQDFFERGSLGSVAEFVLGHAPGAVTVVKRIAA
ncbi:MAG: universal stress protein [Pseudomonadota bacterium]|nr:universal stress protein [Pseudomonadota bacterium]